MGMSSALMSRRRMSLVVLELPVLVAVRAVPLPVAVVPLVLEADGDAVSGIAPELLDQAVVELSTLRGGAPGEAHRRAQSDVELLDGEVVRAPQWGAHR
jgi:hypothetical protein